MAKRRSSKSELKKQVREAAKAVRETLAALASIPPIMTSMPEPVKAEVEFNMPGLKRS